MGDASLLKKCQVDPNMKIVLFFAALVSLAIGQYGFQQKMWAGIPYVYHSIPNLHSIPMSHYPNYLYYHPMQEIQYPEYDTYFYSSPSYGIDHNLIEDAEELSEMFDDLENEDEAFEDELEFEIPGQNLTKESRRIFGFGSKVKKSCCRSVRVTYITGHYNTGAH